MSRNQRIIALRITATVATAACLAAAAPLLASADVRVKPTSVVPDLADAGTLDDALAPSIRTADLGQGGIVESTSRHLGDKGSAKFWVALDAASEICLVTRLEDHDVTAATCASAARVSQIGLTLQASVVEGGDVVTAVLAPSDVRVEASKDWTFVAPNLIATEKVATGDALPAAERESSGSQSLLRIR